MYFDKVGKTGVLIFTLQEFQAFEEVVKHIEQMASQSSSIASS
jgi:hypothetical protein